ncbi:pilus assembly protein [Actinomadura darangshiensis]|uniref:Pilus assembly protein n=1 Tax=Actinomadura darangshiensis TaxID=705336 RepID=A0A4R5B8E7_9ACTN|nr:TadE family protein [Actinomadura darangshiensis]TDD79592.1 pilus assembly protein [Actinomadura darangshiensis]
MTRGASGRSRRSAAAPGDRGGVSLEFAGVLPSVLTVIFFCLEFLLVGITVERVENAARTGARVAAQRQEAGACETAAMQAMPGWLNEKKVTSATRDGGVVCRVRAKVPVLIKGVPLDFTMTRTVEMPVG